MSVDTHFYPLGSCTMKYNPKRNERLASLPGLADLHPYQPQSTLQGLLEILYSCQVMLAEIAGLDAVSLQPAAGATAPGHRLLVRLLDRGAIFLAVPFRAMDAGHRDCRILWLAMGLGAARANLRARRPRVGGTSASWRLWSA